MPEKTIDMTRLAAFADLQLLTVTEVAHLAQTGEDWIRKGCQANLLPYTRVGDTYRFTRTQVEQIWAIKARDCQHIPTRDEVAARRSRSGQRAAA